jgi:phosphoadenosine phosphosulfate reductase
MVKKGIPTRIMRWCCRDYKEGRYSKNSVLIMGIRAEESPRRAKAWTEVHVHTKTKNTIINPIFDWASDELWDFIKGHKIPYCPLYDEGFSRLGCIGCPMGGKAGRLKDFKRWPQYEKKWKRSFEKLWDRRAGTLQRDGRVWFGEACFDNWQEMWNWWLYDLPLPDPRQLKLAI